MSGSAQLTGQTAAKANKLLPKIAKLFKKNNIAFCLDGGTLLGIVRENRLLPWDNDLDFFVHASEARKIQSLKFRLMLMGCRLQTWNAEDNYGPIKKGSPRIYKIRTKKKYGGHRIFIDLIFKYSDEHFYHWVVGRDPSVHKKVPKIYYDQFETINYNGDTYPTPSNVNSYLECRYGPNWKTPKKEWDFRVDDKAKI